MIKAEWIRTMTNEEMARLFYDMSKHRYDYPYSSVAWVDWLKEEIDDETATL